MNEWSGEFHSVQTFPAHSQKKVVSMLLFSSLLHAGMASTLLSTAYNKKQHMQELGKLLSFRMDNNTVPPK